MHQLRQTLAERAKTAARAAKAMAHREPAGKVEESLRPLDKVDVLWITAGLGCDGDTIAATAATQPSLEDILLGALPWIPETKLHNPFLALEVSEDLLAPFHKGAKSELGPFILVVEGSIPDETNKNEGYWASLGTDPSTGQPITTCEWIDRLAHHAWAYPVQPEDVAIGISTSGGSPNIIMALEEARKRNLVTGALLGYDGGEIKRCGLPDFPLVVGCDYIPRIQQVQATIYHTMPEMMEVPAHGSA